MFLRLQAAPQGRQGILLLEHRRRKLPAIPAGGRWSDTCFIWARSNDSQRAAYAPRQMIEAFDENGQSGEQIALFPEDRAAPPLDCDVVHVRLSGLRLRRPRQWGGCWLARHLWDRASTR